MMQDDARWHRDTSWHNDTRYIMMQDDADDVRWHIETHYDTMLQDTRHTHLNTSHIWEEISKCITQHSKPGFKIHCPHTITKT